MRTTLDIDEDILQAAKELAASHKTTTGKMLSKLARQGLLPPKKKSAVRNGVPLLAHRPNEKPVTYELVNQLRDEP